MTDETRSSAQGLADHAGAFRHVSLLLVVGRHRLVRSTGHKAIPDGRQDLGVAAEWDTHD
jgi:hypothetical protein